MISVSLYKELIHKEKPEEILREILQGSAFHRIQGSWEILEAMKWLKEKLDERGIESRILSYDKKISEKLGINVPRWELKYAELEVDLGHETEKLSTEDNILLATPHSPPGESEGEVKTIRGYKEIGEECSDKIILCSREHRLTYYVGKQVGIAGAMFTKETPHEYVFPYFGLFFKEEFLKNAPPCTSIPWSLAKKIIKEESVGGKVRARIYVESERTGPDGIPVLMAEVGEGHTIIGTAHICHPAPGAHDNMSGCIALLHTISLLRELYERGIFRGRFLALWVPEYSGTISYIWEERPRGIGNINLDMVGTRSQSPLKVHRGFLYNPSKLEASFVKSLGVLYNIGGTKIAEIGYKLTSYVNGSDHDLFNYYGLPGFMVAHVIDEMYHTSGDLVNNVDPYLIREVSVASVMSAVLATSKLAEEIYDEYLRAMIGYLKLNSRNFEFNKNLIQEIYQRKVEERETDLESVIPGLEFPLTAGRLLNEEKINLAARFYSERELERVAMYGGSLLKEGTPYTKAKSILEFDAKIPESAFRKFFEMITDEGALERGDRMPLVRARIRIFGRVQGVFFRESMRRVALANNVRGWVRNLPDGSVEAVIQGEEGAVRRVIQWARRGPPLAKVTYMNIVWEEPNEDEFETFEIRY